MNQSTETAPWTVSDLNQYLESKVVSDAVLKEVHVVGEVTGMRGLSGQHAYFMLKQPVKDAYGRDSVVKISCVIWFAETKKFLRIIQNERQIVVRGKIAFYKGEGRCQVNVSSAVDAGEGLQAQRLEALKAELEAKGYFDPSIKKVIGPYNFNIGLVTSAKGDALGDFQAVAFQRNPHVRLYLWPSLVQGQNAPRSIAEGIAELDDLGLDAIVIGRGGGSKEELWAFNDRLVAEAVFRAKTPIVAAVGHTADRTLADLTADMITKTPSNAMEMLVPEIGMLWNKFHQLAEGLYHEAVRHTTQAQLRLNERKDRFQALSPVLQLEEKRHRLDRLAERMERLVQMRVQGAKELLARKETVLQGQSPQRKIEEASRRVERLKEALQLQVDFIRKKKRMDFERRREVLRSLIPTDRLERAQAKLQLTMRQLDRGMADRLQTAKQEYSARLHVLKGLSPLERLESGYLYAMYEGKRVTSTREIAVGDELTLYSKDECLTATVTAKTDFDVEENNE